MSRDHITVSLWCNCVKFLIIYVSCTLNSFIRLKKNWTNSYRVFFPFYSNLYSMITAVSFKLKQTNYWIPIKWARGRALPLEQARTPWSAARTDLGSCHLENFALGKLPLEKISLGNCRLGKFLGRVPNITSDIPGEYRRWTRVLWRTVIISVKLLEFKEDTLSRVLTSFSTILLFSTSVHRHELSG